MNQISVEKLKAMRVGWTGVLADKQKTIARLRGDLLALKAAGNKADIDPVLTFYETILAAGKAAGRVILLDDLIKSMGDATEHPVEAEEGFHL